MNDETKKKLTNAGVEAGAGLFSKLMDRMAKKRPNGLVARFRRRFGKLEPHQIQDATHEAIEETKRLRGRK